MEPRNVIVLTPPGVIDPSLAIAACRAGAVGVLDLEFLVDYLSAVSAIERILHFTSNRFGIQIRPDSNQLESFLSISVKPKTVILTGIDSSFPSESVRKLQASPIEILLEATSLGEAIKGIELGVSGIILKGHEAGGRVGADTSFVLLQKWLQYADRHNLRVPFWVRGGIGPRTAAA